MAKIRSVIGVDNNLAMAKDKSILSGDNLSEDKKTALMQKLQKGEESGFVEDFDKQAFLKHLHKKRLK